MPASMAAITSPRAIMRRFIAVPWLPSSLPAQVASRPVVAIRINAAYAAPA